MKKIVFSLILLGVCLTSIAQFEIKYNRFRHPREEHIIIARDLLSSYRSTEIDCNAKDIKTSTIESKSIYYSNTASIESKREMLRDLVYTNCQEVIDFYVNIIKNDQNKEMRQDAILYLGWLWAKSSIPVLLEAAKKENDVHFVIEIASTLCTMEEFELAASILDRVCFNENGSVKKECIRAYASTGSDELVKNYYLSEWEKDNDEETKFGIALRLTEYGIYDITFPVIREALNSPHTYKRHSALSGLAAIATEEALELIQECTNDNDIVIANFAKFIILCLEEGRDYHGRRDK